MPARRPAWPPTSIIATRSMTDEVFWNADGELLIVPAGGPAALPHRVRHHRRRARRDRRHPARREVRGRSARRAGARLRLRELRRRLHAARARTDRRQLPRQRARFPDPGRRLRGPRRADQADRQMVRLAVADDARPLAARRRRLARQLRALQIRPAPLLARRRHRLRPSRSVDLLGADGAVRDARLAPTSTSSSSPSAGWWPRTPSARPGIIATS